MKESEITSENSSEVIDLPSKNDLADSKSSHNTFAKTSIARWYAIQVASSCEKKVKATLEQR